MLQPSQDASTVAWMERNMLGEQEFVLSAWKVFLTCACLGIAAALATFLALGPWEGFLAIVAATVAPFIASSYVSNRPSRMARRESLSYLRHAPSVIGAMAMSMTVSPSLDKAVLFASRSSLDPLGRRLALASWSVLTRSWPDIESALVDLAGSLGETNHALRQSLYLFSASSHEPTKEGMERLMEKAHEISVQGLRDAAERYVAGLSTPVMAIFALGILLPIMLLSIVPLLSMTGPVPDGAVVVGSRSPPMLPISILLLVIIPLSCLLYSRSLVSSSPMADAAEAKPRAIGLKDWPWMIWLLALAGYALAVPVQTQPYLTLVLLSMPPALIILQKGAKRPKKKVRPRERDFILGLYQLGNRLSTGASLERAMAEAAGTGSKGAFAEWCAAVLHQARMARIPLDEAMGAIDPIPDRPLVHEAFITVARCAQGDGEAAGRIAARLAKSLGQILDCEEGVKERMRGVVDMMRSTSLLFAPIVLGVTVGLFGLTSSFTGGGDATGWVTLMAGIYVVELGFVVTYLTTFLVENNGWPQLAQGFASRMPLAVLAFISVSLLTHAGFARWW